MSPTWITCPQCKVMIPTEGVQNTRRTQCPSCAALLIPVAESSWYYLQNRQKVGPVPWSDLQKLVEKERIKSTDMLLQDGGWKWIPASSVPGLFADATVPLAVPAARQPAAVNPIVPVDDLATTAPFAMPRSEPTDAVLPTLPGYQILGELGRGGMGVVYKARQLGLNRLVALKMILSGVHAGKHELARFRAEAEAVAKLHHANIVQIHEIGEQDGRPFFSLEYVDGGGLDQKLASKPMPARSAAGLVQTLAGAVQYAHEHGIVHRDLKPANVLLQNAERRPSAAENNNSEAVWQAVVPKIADFGLAKDLESKAENTNSGAIMGTPSYFAPEQSGGRSAEIGPPTDVYALGAILYELLTGGPPFRGATPLDTILMVISQDPVPPRQLQPKVPIDLETICLKCLNKQPQRRYASAQALADDLGRFLNGEPTLARPAGPIERGWRWCRRYPIPASLLVVVSLLLVVVSLGSAIGLWHLSQLSEDLVHSTAIEGAAQESEILDEVNNFYSAQVVNRVKPAGIKVTHDYTHIKDSIPVPASLTIDLGNQISEKSERGMKVRLYSDYPFKTRTDGGPKDVFEREALEQLRKDPSNPVFRFETVQGRPMLRYATARVMKQSCLKCHNEDPDSPKQDWKVGDVRGVLEIVRPLDRDVRGVRRDLRGSFLLIATVSGLLFLGLATLVVVVGWWARNHARAKARV